MRERERERERERDAVIYILYIHDICVYVQGETEEEKAFRLEQLRGDNTAAAHALCALVEQHPDLAAQIEGVLQASGIVPPSRPPSVAVSDVSSLEED